MVTVTVLTAFAHVERFDAPVVDCTRDSMVQIVVNLCVFEFGPFGQRNYFSELLHGPTERLSQAWALYRVICHSKVGYPRLKYL